MPLIDYIEIIDGNSYIRGTDIPVLHIIHLIKAGIPVQQVYPNLTENHLNAVRDLTPV